MKKKIPGLWLFLAIGVLLAAAGSIFFFFGKQGIAYLYVQRKQDRAAIESDRRIIDSLRHEIKRLTSDTSYIERIAREKFGMARPNEKVYKFIEKRK